MYNPLTRSDNESGYTPERRTMTTMTMTRKSYYSANVSLTIEGVTYKGNISNPAGAYSPDEWISTSLLQGMILLSDGEFTAVCQAMRAAY
jgi:hypothetical protein